MTVVAGLLQTTTGIDPAANAADLAAGIARLAEGGAQIVFTPEMSGVLDRDRARLAASVRAEADDAALAAARETAARHRVWVQLGSLALRDGPDLRLVNRAFLIDDRGDIRARYDKLHLFDVDLPDGERIRESDGFRPGTRAVAAETPWGRLGLTICYDLRFPMLHAGLARGGARMIAVPSAFTRPTGAAHWEVLLRARAIETGCFVIAAAQTGRHADGRATWGHSLVVDPWGEVVLDMGQEPGAATVALDLARVTQARARIPSLTHVREFALSAA